MQILLYKSFAYAISVISEGQGGGLFVSGTFSKAAYQTWRNDLLVRSPLRAFEVQEIINRSPGWARENIWELHCTRKHASTGEIHAPRREYQWAY